MMNKAPTVRPLTPAQERKVALAELDETWLALLESSLEHFAIVDISGRVVYTNRGIPGFFPVTGGGRLLRDLVPPQFRATLEKAMASAAVHSGDSEVPVAIIERTPEMVVYAIRLSAIHQQDRVVGYLLSSQDISEYVETQERLRSERNRAQQYLDIAEVVLVVLDDRGLVQLINRKGADLLGYREAEIVGRNWFDQCLPKESGPAVKAVFRQLMLGELEPVEYYENTVVTRSGKARLIAWHNTVIRREDGSIKATLSSGQDITEQRLAQEQLAHYQQDLESQVAERTEQLERANEKLRQAYQERLQIEEQVNEHRAQLAHVCRLSTMSELATTISHELNQPLSAVTNYATGIRRRVQENPELTPEIMDALEQIVIQAERAGKVLQRTRDFVTNRSVQMSEVALDEVIRRSVELMLPKAKRQAVQIQILCDPALPGIRGDAIQLEQVIVNLLSNAIEALEDAGEESGQIQIVAQSGPDQDVEIVVHDNGPGIQKDKVDSLFDAFMTTKANGMGMGLSISRSIVEAHNGRMCLDSNDPSGATFRIRLPLGEDEAQ